MTTLTPDPFKPVPAVSRKRLIELLLRAFDAREGFQMNSIQLKSTVEHQGNFSGLDFTCAEGVEFDWGAALLEYCHFNYAVFPRCDFSLCSLTGSILQHTVLDYANFVRAWAEDCDFRYGHMREARLNSFHAKYSHFDSIEAPGLDGRSGIFRGCTFTGAYLDGADFRSCDLTACDFSRAILTNAQFERAEIGGCDFADAILTGSDLERILNGKTKYWHIMWRGRHEGIEPTSPEILPNYPLHSEFSLKDEGDAPGPMAFYNPGPIDEGEDEDGEPWEEYEYEQVTGNDAPQPEYNGEEGFDFF